MLLLRCIGKFKLEGHSTPAQIVITINVLVLVGAGHNTADGKLFVDLKGITVKGECKKGECQEEYEKMADIISHFGPSSGLILKLS
jgi:hypothetical protein